MGGRFATTNEDQRECEASHGQTLARRDITCSLSVVGVGAKILPMKRAVVVLFLVWSGVAVADDPAPTVLTGRITDVLGKPIDEARIYVLPRAGDRLQTSTNKDGRYTIELPLDGAIGVVIAVDRVHTFRNVLIQRATSNTLDVEVEIDTAGGEVIKIVDHKLPTPAVLPKPMTDPQKALPYSQAAFERDAWAKAWLLLDVDEQGVVTRLKLLKAPGFDLDEIAIEEGFKLRFEPARDAAGNAIRTHIVWSMEWPSWNWIIQEGGTIGRNPTEHEDVNQVPHNYRGDLTGANWARPTVLTFPRTLDRVPCAGSGPLNLDARNRAYRDCSGPGIENADALPWITRETASTYVAELKHKYVPMEMHRGSIVPPLIASGVTVALFTGLIVSYTRFQKYSRRDVDIIFTPEQHAEVDANNERVKKWHDRSIGFAIGLVVSGGVTAFFWSRRESNTSFSVQPTADGGGSVSYGGSF